MEKMPMMPTGGTLSYATGTYGFSQLAFRDPQPVPDGPYVAFVGGTEIFGRFLPRTLPQKVEALIGVPALNFGIVNSGIGAQLGCSAVMTACHDAAVTVLDLTGAQNLSNRFYAVHPRRNDRIVKVSPLLRALYAEVDFADFVFTRHMLAALRQTCEVRFGLMMRELRRTWLDRMHAFLDEVPNPVLLLWIARRPPAAGETEDIDPLYVTAPMVQRLADRAAGLIVEVPNAAEHVAGLACLGLRPGERAAADLMVGEVSQDRAAGRIAAALRRVAHPAWAA